MKKQNILIRPILLVLALYLFFVSIKLMGASFKLFGGGFAENLIQTTSNPFVGLLIGILATSLMQSSSSTTSILVTLVAVGAVPLRSAIPIVMGANIGTTITNTIVSLTHITRKQEFERAFAGATVHDFFNFIAVLILFPIEMFTHIIEKSAVFLSNIFFGIKAATFTSPLDYVVKPAVNIIKNVTGSSSILMLFLALIILFGALTFFTKIMKSLIAEKTENFIDSYLFKMPAIAFLVGLTITMVVQSSSITTSLVVPLVGAGILTVRKIFPYTLGTNVGTTITAILAALVTGNIVAITVAFSHLLFNVFGIIIIYPFREIPITFAQRMGYIGARSKKTAFLFIIASFYLVPLILIILMR